VQKQLIKELPDKGWASSSLEKLLNYLNILPACFASSLHRVTQLLKKLYRFK